MEEVKKTKEEIEKVKKFNGGSEENHGGNRGSEEIQWSK